MERQLKILIDKGFSYLGMINEAKLKCVLLKQRINKTKDSEVVVPHFTQNINAEMMQIKSDLAKYTHKLKKVREELREYGVVTELE
jgi:hypothetical protein